MHTVFPRVSLCFLLWPRIFITSTPTKPHILQYVRGSEFSEGLRGLPLLSLLFGTATFGSHHWVRFHLVPPLESLYPLLGHQCRHSGPVDLGEMIRRIVVDVGYNVWPEPPFCEVTRRPMFVLEADVVN